MRIRLSSYSRLGWVRLVLCSVFLSNAAAAYAANLGFLTDTSISYMDQRDLQQLNRAARTALDSKQDGEALDWNNDGTGNPIHVEGTITPLNTQKDGDQSCRTLAIVAKAKARRKPGRRRLARTAARIANGNCLNNRERDAPRFPGAWGGCQFTHGAKRQSVPLLLLLRTPISQH